MSSLSRSIQIKQRSRGLLLAPLTSQQRTHSHAHTEATTALAASAAVGSSSHRHLRNQTSGGQKASQRPRCERPGPFDIKASNGDCHVNTLEDCHVTTLMTRFYYWSANVVANKEYDDNGASAYFCYSTHLTPRSFTARMTARTTTTQQQLLVHASSFARFDRHNKQ